MSGMRDYLVFPKLVRIAPYDSAASAATALGVDQAFREINVRNPNREGAARETGRRESALVELEAQIETDAFKLQQLGPLGPAQTARMVLIVRMSDLEDLNLLDATTREPLIKAGDRLAEICERDGTVEQTIPPDPGLYVVWVKPTPYGYGYGGANYAEIGLNDRAKQPRGTAAY